MSKSTDLVFRLIGVDMASDKMRAVGTAMEKTQKQSEGLLATVGRYVAFGVVANQVWRMTQAASDLGEAVNLNQRLFKDNADAIEEWASSGAESFGLSKTAAIQSAGQIGGALQNLGYDMDDAATSTKALIQRAGDMASAFNTDVASALAAVQAGLRGETEPLRRFNVFLDEASIKAKALELGLYSGKGALDAHAKALAVEAIVMEDTAAIAGDFAMTADGLANSQRRLQAHMENLRAEMGEAFLPVAETVFGVFNNLAMAAGDANPIIGQTAITFALVAASAAVLQPRLASMWASLSGGKGGVGGIASAFGTVAKMAGITAAVMAGMEILEQARDWANLTESVDTYLDTVSRMKSSEEMATATKGFETTIDSLKERVNDLATTTSLGDWWGDMMYALGQGKDIEGAYAQASDELTAAKERQAVAMDIVRAKAAEEAAETKRLADTLQTTSSTAESFEAAVESLKKAMDEGRSGTAEFKSALDALQQVMFGAENTQIAYEAGVDNLTAKMTEIKDSFADGSKGVTDWVQALDIGNEVGRDLQQTGQAMAGAIGKMAVEAFDRAGGAADKSGKAFQAAQDSIDANRKAVVDMLTAYGLAPAQIDDLIGSMEDWNAIDVVLKELGVDTEDLPDDVAGAIAALKQYGDYKPGVPRLEVSTTKAKQMMGDLSQTVNDWQNRRIPVKPMDTSTNAPTVSRTAVTSLDSFVRKYVPTRPMDATTNTPWVAGVAHGQLNSWLYRYIWPRGIDATTNAPHQAWVAQSAINSVYSRTVWINVGISGLSGAAYNHLMSLMGRAEGGPISPNEVYIVGERGPELFVSDTPGTIVPNHQLQSLRPNGRGGGGVAVGGGSGGDYAPIVLQMDSETVWRGMVKLRRRRGQPLGLS